MIAHLLVFVVFASVFVDLIESGKSDWLIHLDERRNAECFLTPVRHFCHSSEENLPIGKNVNRTTCQLNGISVSFAMLKENQISTDVLIDWLIPFHLIEQYADYLNSISRTSTDETLICNCTLKRLGTDCQYEIENKGRDLINVIKIQRGGKSTGEYETLTSLIDGISCRGASVPHVEWRQICDGISQCEDVSDELNCHRLELNQCEGDKEYRCRNGMCIPKEFVFDGTLDCMDSSDEQELTNVFRVLDSCVDQSRFECDERLCRKDQFSCGDGQCVPWSSLINGENGCTNSRHLAYRCETMDNLLSSRRNLEGICRETTAQLEKLTNTSSCLVSLRHLLTTDREEIVRVSMENILNNCSQLIHYPEKTILSPILVMFYNRTELEMIFKRGISFISNVSKRPHLYCLRGKITCQGQLMTLSGDFCMTNEEFQGLIKEYPFFPLSDLFCEMSLKERSSSQ